MAALTQDLRYALRSLAKSPGFTAAAFATFALGIGATTAIFSVAHSVLWQPLPFAAPERLAVVWETDPHNASFEEGVSAPDFRDWKAQARSFSSLAASRNLQLNLTEAGREPLRISASAISHDLFPMLGAAPRLGRSFRAEDDRIGATGTVILSDGLWRGRFGADPAALGRPIALDGKPAVIVGVMAPGFDFPDRSEAWLALEPNLGAFRDVRGVHDLGVYGRLHDGVTLERAGAEMDAIAAGLARQFPDDNAGRGARVQDLRDALVGDVRPALFILLGAAALLTLIACANVSGLLLARATARAREVAIRRAMGAGGWRLVRQFLTESLVLAIGGGAAGLGIAAWGTDALLALQPDMLPGAAGAGLHLPVLAFSFALAAGSGVLAGLAPALSARRGIGVALREEDTRTASRARARGALVVAQVALACILVTGAGLLLKSLRRLLDVDPGFRASGLLTAELSLPRSTYPEPSREDFYKWPEVLRFYDDVLPRLAALPGSSGATLAMNHPMKAGWTSQIEIDGRPQAPGERDEVRIRGVGPGYFRIVGSPVLSGRALDERDRQGAPHVVVINQALAKKYFPGVDPVGRSLSFWGLSRRIVGVVGNVRFRGLAREAEPAVYPSILQVPISGLCVVARAAGDPAALAPGLREAIRAADPDVALYRVSTAEQLLARSVGAPRFQTTLLSIFGTTALLLAALGLYGLLAYSVARRTREIGIRAALGAGRADLTWMVLREGLGRSLAGLAVGIAGSLGATRLLAGLLYGVRPSDAAVLVGVAATLAAVSIAASYLPARRAARIDPMQALRSE